MMKNPQPLPPGSRHLRDGRVEVNIAAPSLKREGSYVVRLTGRFVTVTAARSWAEQQRRPGERALVTSYSALRGWTPRALDRLTDEGWDGR